LLGKFAELSNRARRFDSFRSGLFSVTDTRRRGRLSSRGRIVGR
jgi:hypothetical protein